MKWLDLGPINMKCQTRLERSSLACLITIFQYSTVNFFSCFFFKNNPHNYTEWYFLLPDSHLWPFGVSLSLSWSLQLRHWFGDGPVHVLHWTAHLRQILSEVKSKFSNSPREIMKRPRGGWFWISDFILTAHFRIKPIFACLSTKTGFEIVASGAISKKYTVRGWLFSVGLFSNQWSLWSEIL